MNAIAPDEFVEAGPFDVILELVGAPNWPGNLEALAMRGRIVVIGVGAGAKTELDLRALMFKRARIMASTMRARPLEEKAIATRLVEKAVLPGFVSGDLVGAGGGDLPAGRRRGRLRALQGRRQARQDRARDVSQLVGVDDAADRPHRVA